MKENQSLLRTLVEFTVAYLNVFMSMPQQLHAAFETCIRCKLCTMYVETDSCVRPGMRLQRIAAELMGLIFFTETSETS